LQKDFLENSLSIAIIKVKSNYQDSFVLIVCLEEYFFQGSAYGKSIVAIISTAALIHIAFLRKLLNIKQVLAISVLGSVSLLSLLVLSILYDTASVLCDQPLSSLSISDPKVVLYGSIFIGPVAFILSATNTLAIACTYFGNLDIPSTRVIRRRLAGYGALVTVAFIPVGIILLLWVIRGKDSLMIYCIPGLSVGSNGLLFSLHYLLYTYIWADYYNLKNESKGEGERSTHRNDWNESNYIRESSLHDYFLRNEEEAARRESSTSKSWIQVNPIQFQSDSISMIDSGPIEKGEWQR
jgi:hypothetical protein